MITIRLFFKRYYGILLSVLMASYFVMITNDINKIGITLFIIFFIIISALILIDVNERKKNSEVEKYSHDFFIDFGFTILIGDFFTYFSIVKIEEMKIDLNLWGYGMIALVALVCIFIGFYKKIDS